MSPIAALLQDALQPAALAITVFLEWWTLWFVLGRSVVPTTLLVLAANTLTAVAAAGVLALGAAGSPDAPVAAASGLAWFGAWVLVVLAHFVVEALFIRTLMRRERPTWHWNPYDLLVFLAANGVTLGVAALV